MKTSQQISDKAYSLFLTYGIRHVTMDHIAAGLGMSKKTIYKYFDNKDALLKTMVGNTIGEHVEDYIKLKNRHIDAILDLFAIMSHAAKLHLKFTAAIMLDLAKTHPGVYELLIDHKNGFIYQAIHDSLHNGIRQRLFAGDFNVPAMARFFLESIATVSVMVMRSDNTLHSGDLQAEIFGHLINGIATSDGIELIGRYRNEHELLLLLKPGDHMFLNA